MFLIDIIRNTINLKMLKIYTILINIFEKRAFEPYFQMPINSCELHITRLLSLCTHRKAGWFQILTENY